MSKYHKPYNPEYSRAYYLKNRERILRNKHIRDIKNRPQRLAYFQANKERIHARQKAWRDAHSEQQAQKSKAWREKQKAKKHSQEEVLV